MRRFQKKPEVTFAFIPGVGRVGPGQVLEGDRFAVFVPSLLVEIPAAPAAPALVEPKVPRASAPRSVIELPAVPVRPPATMAEAGFVAPEELVAAVDAENRQTEAQIEQAVARLDPVEEAPKVAPKPKPSNKKRR